MSEPARRALVWAALALSCGIAQAQTLRLPNTGGGVGAGLLTAPTPAVTREADHITAVVNSSPITANEVRTRAASVERQLRERPTAPAAAPSGGGLFGSLFGGSGKPAARIRAGAGRARPGNQRAL